MPSEYDPIFTTSEEADESLGDVRSRFEAAAKPFLRSPWTWAGWAVILPSAALATGPVAGRFGPSGVLMLWSLAILLGGMVEAVGIFGGDRPRPSPLARWVLHTQGNLSLVAIALSALLLFAGAPWALPGLWLVLIGHSFYVLGGLAFPPFKITGLIYQAGGVASLWPEGPNLEIFALTALAGNLWMAWQVGRARSEYG